MKYYFTMFLAALSLSTIGLFVKLIEKTGFNFMTLNFYRIFIGFLFLLIFVPIIDKNTFKVKKSDLKNYAITGFLFALSLSIYQTSFYFTTIQNAVMINYSYPIFILIFAYFLLKEKITKEKVLTLTIALIGLFIINPIQTNGDLTGNLLAFFAAITYSFLIIMMRKEDKNHSIGSVVWFLGFASLFMLPFPFIYGFGNMSNSLIYILGLGIISTGIAYFFYNLSLEKIEAETGAIIAMIFTPLLSILFAVFIIHETLSLKVIIGGIFLISAGIYMNLAKKVKFPFTKKNPIPIEDD